MSTTDPNTELVAPIAFGLIVIGDEVLNGTREDAHLGAFKRLLTGRGHALAWYWMLPDDPATLIRHLRDSMCRPEPVFCCGGIGATPDDHTRQAAAAALGLPLLLHPEAEALIARRCRETGQAVTPGRLQMGEFPQGATIIPNPVNQVPGFSIRRHHFVPGFPDMAWPMIEWVLDHHYRDLFGSQVEAERGMIVRGLAEATLTPLMQGIERDFAAVKVFSLPILDLARPDDYRIELGVKGDVTVIDAAFARLRDGTAALGGRIDPQA